MQRVDQLKKHAALPIILLIYTTLAMIHSLIVPLTTGNDEWAHFLYTRFIAEHGRLPLSQAEREEAGYKSDAPPLYHLIVAALTAGVDPSRVLRPIDSPPRELADNIVHKYALVHTGVELPPYRGEVLLWHLGRGVSILFGAGLITVTYLTTRQLFPDRRRALTAAALLAFTPALIFHSSVLSYESLSALLTALFLLVAIKVIRQPEEWRWWLLLGVLAGLSITTKYSAILLPLELAVVVWLALRTLRQRAVANDRSKQSIAKNVQPTPVTLPAHVWRGLVARLLVAALLMALATSWWFGYIIWNFNTVETQGPLVGVLRHLLIGDASDTTSVNVAAFLFGQEAVEIDQRPPQPRHYLQLLQTLLDSFWAAPVAGQFILSPWLSLCFSLFALLGLAGLWPVWRGGSPADRTGLILLLLHSLLIVPLLMLRVLFSFEPQEVAQGRHLLLPAASAIPILLVWGWDQWSHKVGQFVVVGLLLWSGLGQVAWAAVVYPPPLPVWPETVSPPGGLDQLEPPAQPLISTGMQLAAVNWQETAAGQSLEVTLWWQALATMTEDYLPEMTLLDEGGNVVSYTVSHPVQGRYPSRAWELADLVKDVHWLPLIGPLKGNYQLQLRLLDHTGQLAAGPISLGTVSLQVAPHQPQPCAIRFQGRPRVPGYLAQPYRQRSTLMVIGPTRPILRPLAQAELPAQEPFISVDNIHIFMVGPDWAESYQLLIGSQVCGNISVDLPRRNFTIPAIASPLEVTFNNEVRLLGYELPTRRINPGERLPLTLYWQALDYIGHDYRIFDNLLDASQRRWGGYDRRARDGYSTLLWAPDEVITDAFGAPVDPTAPAGIYTLVIGLYQQTEAGASSLPITVDGQPVEQRSIRLGPIKVGGPPPDVVVNNPSPQVMLNRSFGNQITLLGYDLTPPTQNSQFNPQQLNLTLYWRAEAIPETDYTTFVHLRDNRDKLVAQQDGPPANGRYPSSLWDAGEIIVDEVSLPVSGVPAGDYTLVVGLYDFANGQRLPVADNPANELRLESATLP